MNALKIDSDERPRLLAQYLTEHDSTVRATAAVFGVSKSTVHKDLTSRLKQIDPILYAAAERVLEKNKSERHLRGGNATKLKYETAKRLKMQK